MGGPAPVSPVADATDPGASEFQRVLGLLRDEQVYEVGRNTNFPLHPAHYWTHIADIQALDFIGRVETFEADLQRFLSQVGIAQSVQANENVVDLVGDAGSDPPGYRYVARMSARSRARINELFAKDFDRFGYDKRT